MHDVQRHRDEHAGDVDRNRGLPRRAFEREAAREPEDGRREHRPRIPVAQVEREQQPERRRLVGERRDEIERRERREEAKRGRDAEDHANGNASGVGGHGRTIGLPRPAVKRDAIHHTVRPTRDASHCRYSEERAGPRGRWDLPRVFT